MPIDPNLIAQAKRELKRIADEKRYTPEEIKLMQKYPKCTLEAAKYIDSCEYGEVSVRKGHEDSFYKLRMQETHNLKIS